MILNVEKNATQHMEERRGDLLLNVQYLDDLMNSKGLKRSYVAEKMGMPVSTFFNKTHGNTEFTYEEAIKLFEVLETNKEQQKKIFTLM